MGFVFIVWLVKVFTWNFQREAEQDKLPTVFGIQGKSLLKTYFSKAHHPPGFIAKKSH